MASSGVRGVSSSTGAKAVLFRAKRLFSQVNAYLQVLVTLAVEEAATNMEKKLGYPALYSST